MSRTNEPAVFIQSEACAPKKMREIPNQLAQLAAALTHLEDVVGMLHTKLSDAGVLIQVPSTGVECSQDENVCSEMGRTIQGMTASVSIAQDRIVYLTQSLAL